ncbi:Dynein heavy chain 17, axonemal [Collichthys lucidus]|uniref:Dynein heavy chain 17, axonemal n=1 Tax=Collichthys lucidus TaxID=240159 RepID=A0A4V6AQ65_COLLU|nr:Dynein heavy chain 17, axonemal [Collichthys lucidus]
MDAKDQRLDPVRCFTVNSLRLDPERWREFVSEEESRVTLSSFFNTQDYSHLFIHQGPEDGLSASLHFPKQVHTKVIRVSKTGRDILTKENTRTNLMIQEEQGGDVVSSIITVCQELTCPLLSNPETNSSWAVGVAEEALRSMETLKNEALVIKAHTGGRTFLPQPDIPHDQHLHGNDVHGDTEEWKLSDRKLLHNCDSTIIGWAGLVSDFLQQESCQSVPDGPKPLPSEEFSFWTSRLKNLVHIQEQLSSSRGQQVALLLQRADSVYWSTLRDVHRNVHRGVKEAEDVTLILRPLQEKLEQVEQMEYQQLGANMAAVMEAVRLVWTGSEFYRRPCRMVVLLQKISNLLVHLSRKCLRGQEVMRGLMSSPGPVLDDVRLVIWTLQSFKEAYIQCRTLLENQNQLHQLDQVVLSGVDGRMWTDVVQGVYEDFLCHVTALSDCDYDPTDPDDQSFELHLDQFVVQVTDLESRLVSVLSRAFEDCCDSSSAAQLVKMFRFLLDRPLIQDQVRPHLIRLVETVLVELDQTERLLSSQKDRAATFSRDDITQSYLSLSHMVSRYNEVVSDVLQVERPLIQDQLQDLNRTLSELQTKTWTCEGVQHLVEQHRHSVLIFHSTVSEARANMDAMTHIIQGWAELQLLQRSGESLLEGGATEQSYRRIREDGQELLRLTQVNCDLYRAEDSSDTWIRYLDHIDDLVQDGLLQLLLRSLHFFSDNTNSQVHLSDIRNTQPSVGGGLFDLVKSIITDIYTAANQLARISVSRHGNYQETLQQCQDLRALEQEVMRHMQQVRDDAESLREGLDRYAHLWESDRQGVMHEFLKYGRQVRPEEPDAEETPPTLKDVQREIESLHRLSEQVTHLDDVIVLHGWLQVDLRPFRDSLLSIIYDWRHMYTEYLLDSVSDRPVRSTGRSGPVHSPVRSTGRCSSDTDPSSGPEQTERGTMMRTYR